MKFCSKSNNNISKYIDYVKSDNAIKLYTLFKKDVISYLQTGKPYNILPNKSIEIRKDENIRDLYYRKLNIDIDLYDVIKLKSKKLRPKTIIVYIDSLTYFIKPIIKDINIFLKFLDLYYKLSIRSRSYIKNMNIWELCYRNLLIYYEMSQLSKSKYNEYKFKIDMIISNIYHK